MRHVVVVGSLPLLLLATSCTLLLAQSRRGTHSSSSSSPALTATDEILHRNRSPEELQQSTQPKFLGSHARAHTETRQIAWDAAERASRERRRDGLGMDSGVVRCLVSSSICFVFPGEFSPNFNLKKYDFDLYRRAGFLWRSQSGDHRENNLGKFGYIIDMKVVKKI